jgi:hypothetical protein
MKASSTERRAYQRYHVKDRIMLYNGSTFAEIVNISKGGILCRFLLDTQGQLYPVRQIDLIDAPGKIFIQKISCHDLNWHETEIHRLFGTTALRNCRLQFIQLPIEKQTELEVFINSVVTAPC